MKIYWCRCADGQNFGDRLGEAILGGYTTAEWAPVDDADVVVTGSIAEHLPAGWAGIVAGIGAAHAKTRPDLRAATVVALRGALTLQAARLTGDAPVLGDPGLLACDLLDRRPDTIHDVGLIPHYADSGLPHRDGHVIDVRRPIVEVIEDAARCDRIVASSLHGLILADALGLPRRWETYPRVQGRGHKFHDYASALGETIKPGRWHTASASKIAAIQTELREALASVVAARPPQ